MGAKRTAWHFYFCILLRRYAPKVFEIRDEVPLSEEPPRLDFLILRKDGELSPTYEAGHWSTSGPSPSAELKTMPGPYEPGQLDRLWIWLRIYLSIC
jgi:hypothetical protein